MDTEDEPQPVERVVCPACGTVNSADAMKCATCGYCLRCPE